jgi:hypothetical protein
MLRRMVAHRRGSLGSLGIETARPGEHILAHLHWCAEFVVCASGSLETGVQG